MLDEIGAFVTTLRSVACFRKYRAILPAGFAQLPPVPARSGGGPRTRRNEVSVDRIEADQIRNYLTYLMKRASRATAQRHLSAIKAFFRHREVTIGGANPTRGLRSPRREKYLPSVLQEPEVTALIGDIPEAADRAGWRDRAMAETLVLIGLRISELVALNWADLDLEMGMVRVRHGKGNKERIVPIGEPALQALAQWRQHLPVDSRSARTDFHQSARQPHHHAQRRIDRRAAVG